MFAPGGSGGGAIGCLPSADQTAQTAYGLTQIALARRTNKTPDEVLAAVRASALIPTPRGRVTPKVGTTVSLAMGGGAEFVPVAASYPSLVEFSRALTANDTYGVGELMRTDQVRLIERGTRALILVPESGQGNALRVRLMDGMLANQIVFIASGWAS